MKNTVTSILIMIIFCFNANAQKSTDLKEVKIKTSAQCNMCKQTIEKTMAFEKGIKSANLDVSSAILTVSFKTNKTTIDKIKDAINKAGYDADDSPANEKAYNNLPDCCKKGGMEHH